MLTNSLMKAVADMASSSIDAGASVDNQQSKLRTLQSDLEMEDE